MKRVALFCLAMFPIFSSCVKGRSQSGYDKLYQENDAAVMSRGLPNPHTVANYKVTNTKRLVTRDFSTVSLGKNVSFSVGQKLLLIRDVTLDGVDSAAVVSIDRYDVVVVSKQLIHANTEDGTFQGNGNDFLAWQKKLENRTISSVPSIHHTDGRMDFTLTVDLCQSSLDWERRLFDWLTNLSTTRGKPTSVGIAITGGWMKNHYQEFLALKKWRKDNVLDLVWINHSYSHPLNGDGRGNYEFLTASTVDFRTEVLGLETLLMEQGETFSPLFRFPGLWHNQTRRKQLSEMGLFALDSNSWLAKGEVIKNGSLILVHGNGNEPEGIDRFLSSMSGIRPKLLNGTAALINPLLVLPY